MRLHSVILGSFLVVAAACGGSTISGGNPALDAGPVDPPTATADAAAPVDDVDVPLVPASKVDILLVVDNSASMADKAEKLAASVGTLIRAVSNVGDLHIGVVASSLGSFGGDVCPNEGAYNDKAHLRTSPAAANGVLTYSAGGSIDLLVKDTEDIVRAVGQNGCGLEAQLETAYRFLVQPDPWVTVKLDANNQADLGPTGDVDVELLAQRKAFLRPDSALLIVLLTDEDDSSPDPLSIGGQGWAFSARNFPGSKVFRGDPRNGTTAPRGTSACTDPTRGPDHADCTSCAFQSLCNAADPACQKIKDDPNCQLLGSAVRAGDSEEGYAGYYPPTEDALNVRYHRMKERFGVDPQFPIERYVTGFSKSRVPTRATEHPTKMSAAGRREIGPYTSDPTCVNPIFAANLPSQPGDEICEMGRGPRSRELVLFAVIGGVPGTLAGATPNWNAIVGADPDAYDFTGMDAHMVQSVAPRAGLQGPTTTRGDNGVDPIHGREWNTLQDDLQFACTFALTQTRTCTAQDPSCDCALSERNPPLCGATLGTQLRGKAYPTMRPLRVARGLGDRGVIGSICSETSYEETMTLIAQKISPKLAP
jgi:hypothetical protein